MPRQLHTRGDKLVFSNGILLLAGFAALLIVAFDADVTRLIQLYIIGVFTSFTIGQWGMVRHWNREMKLEQDPAARRRMRRSQIINTVGGTPHHRRPGDHRDHQVHPRRLARPRGDADPLRADEGDQPALLARRRAARARHRRAHAAQQGARRRPGVEGAQADAAGAGLRPGHPARRAHRADGQRRRRRHPRAADRLGALRHPGAADRRSSRRTGRSPGRSSTSSRTSAGTAPASSSWSSSRSTSSGTGGRTCCTTRARCGCAPGCSSSPAS